jgi:hypothetical protein
VVDFSTVIDSVWLGLYSLLISLPGSISGSAASNSRPPSLLRLINSLAQHETTVAIVAKRESIVKFAIECIAGHRVSFPIVQMVMQIFSSLLDYDNGSVVLAHSEVTQLSVILIGIIHPVLVDN